MQKALDQDSTVYDYDAVYDDIQNQRLENSKKILHGTDKKVIFLMLNTCEAAFVNTGTWEGMLFNLDMSASLGSPWTNC